MEFSATFLLSVLIVALLWFFSGKNTQKYRLPPGPSPLPLIGNLLQLKKAAPFKSFLEFSKTYGPVMTFNLGWQRVVVLVGYDTVKEALVDQADDFVGRAPMPFLYRATRGYGNFFKNNLKLHVKALVAFCATFQAGIGISNGERWRQLRRFTLSTLRDFGMGRKGMEEWIQEESKHLRARMRTYKLNKLSRERKCHQKYLQKHKIFPSTKKECWKSFYYLAMFLCSPPGEPFDPTILLSRTVSNVVCCLVFGQRFSYEDKHFVNLLAVIAMIVRFNSSPKGMMYNIFPWLMERLPGKQHAVFGKIEEIRDFVKMKIQEHRDSLDPSSPRDFIDCFLIRVHEEKENPSTEFHYDNLVATVMNLFLAGTETTSSTIRHALSVLIKHRNIQEKMQEEIDSVIGRERCPNMEDRKSLPFSDAVIHEIQRFLDIVPFSLPHYALQDVSFRGYTIPKVSHRMQESIPLCKLILSNISDTVIVPLLHSVLKEEKQWATPHSFNPQHFLDQNGNFKKNPAFLPFSAGKRACVGESLARMELFIFIVTLLQDFTFTCPGGPDSINLIPEYSSFANLPRSHKIIATPR
uniref:Cytochrome P450 2G1-like n=1 Tax=Poecilia formosa TaxID=48698 RepID=A0A096M595_POEFO